MCVEWKRVWISELLKILCILVLNATLFWGKVGRMPWLPSRKGESEVIDGFAYC